MTERTTSEGTSRYAYDAEGRLTQLTAPDGKTTTYAYDAAGRNTQSVQQLIAGVELVTDRRYDAQDRQVAIAHSKRVGPPRPLAGQAVGRGAGRRGQPPGHLRDGSASFNDTTGAFGGNPARVQTFGSRRQRPPDARTTTRAPNCWPGWQQHAARDPGDDLRLRRGRQPHHQDGGHRRWHRDHGPCLRRQ